MKAHRIRAQRFPRHRRLRRPGEFSRVMAAARRSSDEYFTVLSRSGPFPYARLGLAVSKKVARRAVDRNRIKRLAREAFRQCGFSQPADVVVFARRAAAGSDKATLRQSLDRHLRRLLAAEAS